MGIATSAPNATTTAPGLVQLAGGLGGTATAPTVSLSGSTGAGTSGSLVALTISNSSTGSTVGLSVTLGNTQTSYDKRGIQVDMGSSGSGGNINYGVYVFARNVVTGLTIGYTSDCKTTTTNGVGFYFYGRQAGQTVTSFTGSEGTGYYADLAGSGHDVCLIAADYGGSNVVALGWSNAGGGVVYAYTTGNLSNGSPQAERQLYLRQAITSTTTGRTTNTNDLQISRSYASATQTDNYAHMALSRTTISNGGTITSQGSVLSLTNTATQTSGTLNDSVTPLLVTQGSGSTGHPISITQNAVVSTNFKRIISLAGVTLWISNATDPNGTLTGTAGDVCFNGLTNKIQYCTGTTVWV